MSASLSWVADKQPMVDMSPGAIIGGDPYVQTTRPARAGDLIDAPCPECDGEWWEAGCDTCDGRGTVPAVLDEDPVQDEVRISHMENGEWVRTVPVTTHWLCAATPKEDNDG